MKYEREILSDERLAGALDAAKRGAYSHAYALIADDLYTTSVAAAHLVAAITGASPQRVNQGGYADVHVLPVGKDKILSADVDFITSTAYLTPTELNKKFYVLEKASTMNESSQNKLLKTLEEAPPSVIIILEADKPSALLPTVLSRCVRVDIAPIAPDVLAEALSKHYPGREVYSAAALSGGYAGRAETILSDENYEKDFALAFDTLRFSRISFVGGLSVSAQVDGTQKHASGRIGLVGGDIVRLHVGGGRSGNAHSPQIGNSGYKAAFARIRDFVGANNSVRIRGEKESVAQL